MNIILSKPFGFKKLYETMMKIMPESMGWAIPRGLRSKRNRCNKEHRMPIQGGIIGGQGNGSSNSESHSSLTGQSQHSRDTEGRNVPSKTTDITMIDTGDRGLLQESVNGLGSVGSAPHGPFCLRPMSIANIINEKNYDPKKREHTDMEQPNGADNVEGLDCSKKRRVETMPQNMANKNSAAVDIETSPSNMATNQTASDYGVSLSLKTPSPVPNEQRMQQYRSEDGVLRGVCRNSSSIDS